MDDYENEALPVGEAQVAEAMQTLQRYKAGKAALDKRIVDNELWFRMGHWKNYQNPMMPGKAQPSSGWLFNSIANKHADAMDNYPEPNVLPREADDEDTARALSSVLPVVLEQADYEQVYSDCWWRKLKQGTGVTGIFWDPAMRGGIGDIAVRSVNLLMLYWEPGVDDIQASPHFFSLSLADSNQLEERWLELPVQEIFSGMGTAMGAAMLHTISQREKLLGRSVREDEMEPLDWAALQQARQATAQQLYAARLGFDRAAQLIDAFFSHYDLVLTPTTAVPAQKLGVLRLDQPFESYAREAMNSSAFTSLFNISGHPAMSVPAHWTAQGLPVGAHFVAPYGREDRLLSLAAQLEQAVPWAHRTPDLTPLQA